MLVISLYWIDTIMDKLDKSIEMMNNLLSYKSEMNNELVDEFVDYIIESAILKIDSRLPYNERFNEVLCEEFRNYNYNRNGDEDSSRIKEFFAIINDGHNTYLKQVIYDLFIKQ